MNKNIKINKNKLLFWLVVIDILFLPYFRLVVIPYSYFIILYWVIKNYNRIVKCKETKAIFICMLLMLMSTLYGNIVNSEYGVMSDNLKRLIQYYFVFGYYYFFKIFFEKYQVNLKRILILFVLVFAIIFNSNTSLFGQITQIWNSGNSYNEAMIIDSEYSGVFRYNFIWTDPNNIAYAITGIIIFLFMFTSLGLGEKICLIIINIYILISCMSSGGWINFAISYFAYLLYTFSIKNHLRKNVSFKNILIFVIVISMIIIFSNNIADFLQSDLVSNASDRFGNNENTRSEIWLRILNGENIFKRIFLGKGSEIYINGISRATHSGHLYWIYGYGFISYCILMKNFFYINKKELYLYIPLISFFLCFTMNTMIGEQKLFIIMILIVTYLKKEGSINEKGKYHYSNL